MKPTLPFGWLALLCGLAVPAYAETNDTVSEKDYLDDVPVVLSVSRLPQRLDETPGAVTIIDRQMIRMSGARDVADLLRLVPGFRVSNAFESNTPQGSYHTSLSDYSNHMQVMVDGRSVYSTYLQGSTGPGLQAVALEDIERIEVYRGSNSAAYGARAFLGSINIVTRDTVDTMGVYAHGAVGDHGIGDAMVRYGWGDDTARYRLSMDTRADNGLQGASGGTQVQRVNLRSDLRVSDRDTVELRAGQSVISAGVGFSDEPGNAPRTRQLDTNFFQADWKRNLGPDEDLALQLSHTVEYGRDQFWYASTPSALIDFGGRSSNDNLSLQHTRRLSSTLRVVWGAEMRRETVVSVPIYATDAAIETDFTRVFGNAEWYLHPALILNAGALYEHSNIDGEHLSPRVMLNWKVADGHTLRYGQTEAFRTPSAYEKYANIRYYDTNGALADSTVVARGNVVSEKVQSREFGYLAELPGHALTFDLRVYEEEVRDVVQQLTYTLAGSGYVNSNVIDFVNGDGYNVRGHEFQLKWRPWQDGQLIYNQSYIDSTQSVGSGSIRPVNSQSAMFMQNLPAGYRFSLMYYDFSASHFAGANYEQPAMSRTDLRLAQEMRLAGRKAEWSLVVQSYGGSYQDFMPRLRFEQQVYVMLRLEN